MLDSAGKGVAEQGQLQFLAERSWSTELEKVSHPMALLAPSSLRAASLLEHQTICEFADDAGGGNDNWNSSMCKPPVKSPTLIYQHSVPFI